MQVVRVFCWQQTESMGRDTINHVFEAFQVWFEPTKQKQVIISRPYTRCWNFFRWHMQKEWVVKPNTPTGGYSCGDIYNLDNHCFHPGAKILPILRRNGWNNRMFNMKTSPIDIWRGLLTDPSIETLAKIRQYHVLDYWFSTEGYRKDKSQWLPLVKICARHHYIIKDASMWFDYIDLLRYLNKDTHSPHYICPKNLKQQHDRLMNKKARIEKAEELKRKIAQAATYEKQYKKHRGMFFGISFGNEDIIIAVVSSVAEMVEIGERMHHCVYTNSYYDHNKHPDSLILSAKDKEGHDLETMEVNIKTWKVIQSRGLQNSITKYHSDIIKLVELNIGQLQKATLKSTPR